MKEPICEDVPSLFIKSAVRHVKRDSTGILINECPSCKKTVIWYVVRHKPGVEDFKCGKCGYRLKVIVDREWEKPREVDENELL